MRDSSGRCVVANVVVNIFIWAISGMATAEDLLAIPEWLPREPGGTLEYRVSNTDKRVGDARLKVEIREVTHGTTLYSATAHVIAEDKSDKYDFELDVRYEHNKLTFKLMDFVLVLDNVMPSSSAGDAIAFSMTWVDQGEIAGEATVIATGTKVAIDGLKWNDAIVVGMKIPKVALTGKATLAAPHGLVRASVVRGNQSAVMELVPPRRPFDGKPK